MKKIIIAVVIIAGLLGLNYYEHHYNKEANVIAIKEDNEVIIKDKQGFVWSFYGDGYEVGQEVKAIFFDNTTTSITDDEIVRVK